MALSTFKRLRGLTEDGRRPVEPPSPKPRPKPSAEKTEKAEKKPRKRKKEGGD